MPLWGSEATAAEIAQLQTLIPLRDQAIETSKLNEKQLQKEEQSANRLASTFAGIARQLIAGADAGQVFLSALSKIGSRLLETGLQNLLGGMRGFGGMPGLGGVSGGGGGSSLLPMLLSANGNVFNNGSLMAFANGGVVDRTTMFPMKNGMGMMGEAGPEAIIPLKRGKDGRLGVEATGFSGGVGGSNPVQSSVAQTPAQAMDLTVNVDVTGARGNQEIEEMVRMGVQQGIAAYDKGPARNRTIEALEYYQHNGG